MLNPHSRQVHALKFITIAIPNSVLTRPADEHERVTFSPYLWGTNNEEVLHRLRFKVARLNNIIGFRPSLRVTSTLEQTEKVAGGTITRRCHPATISDHTFSENFQELLKPTLHMVASLPYAFAILRHVSAACGRHCGKGYRNKVLIPFIAASGVTKGELRLLLGAHAPFPVPLVGDKFDVFAASEEAYRISQACAAAANKIPQSTKIHGASWHRAHLIDIKHRALSISTWHVLIRWAARVIYYCARVGKPCRQYKKEDYYRLPGDVFPADSEGFSGDTALLSMHTGISPIPSTLFTTTEMLQHVYTHPVPD